MTTFAEAYKDALRAQAEREEQERVKAEAEAALAAELHVYDPWADPYAEPVDSSLYEGTGIGLLYGIPGGEHLRADLGDWRLVAREAVR